MTVRIYAATTNPGKLRDFSVAAEDGGLIVESLPGLAQLPAPEENASTFEGNARLKAEYYSRLPTDASALVLADDSGLEIDALGGAPGVRSARYALDANYVPEPFSATIGWLGDDTVDIRNNLYLLDQMRGIVNRSARYRCVLALARAGVTILTADGVVNGEILSAPQGRGGFGYDPLFWLPQLSRTMAEISLGEKHTLSHRGRAFRALLPKLRSIVR